MGVYIKGMKMPKSCWDCPMVSGYEIADEARTRCSTVRCRLTNTKRPVGEAIASDCPLVPVPQHGDLIDRDALMRHKGDCYDADGHLLYAVGTGNILRAPTIIPAEEGET